MGLQFIVWIAVLGPAFAAHDADCDRYWGEVRQLNNRFESRHDGAAGQKLLALLGQSARRNQTHCPGWHEALEAIGHESRYRTSLLEKGEGLGFELALRMLRVADGAVAEDLDTAVGQTIRRYPEKFLAYVSAEYGESYCDDGLVGNTGIVDDEAGQQRELDGRIAALKTVKEKRLRRPRDVCISVLKRLKRGTRG